MSYRYYVNKRNPTASFILDDPVPFFDNSGLQGLGGKKTGTSDPSTATALVSGAAYSSVFSSTAIGEFDCPLFKQGVEERQFVLEAFVLPIGTASGPVQILSHDGVYDGLTIDGNVIKFSTMYIVGGDAECDFDLQTPMLAHVVAIHNKDQNQLWVNNKLVSVVDITDEQKASTYPASSTGKLYCGGTATSRKLAVNGIAFYNSLSADQINQNYQAGIGAVPQVKIPSQLDGISFGLNSASGSKYIERSWIERADFNTGLKNNVEYDSEQINPAYSGGLSIAGTWTVSVPLDILGYTSIYGVMIDWSGKDIDVDASLDGTSWSAVVAGELAGLISNGYDPTDKDLQIRVTFSGGLADDPAYLESLTVIAYKDNTFSNLTTRSITAGHPAVLRGDYEPILYRDDNGVSLHGATLTIGQDTSTDPNVARTLELWIKPISGTTTISVTGTKYRNGVADATMPNGEWQLIHIVSATDVTTDITISGNCIVGQIAIYPTALTATNIEHLYQSYTGIPTIKFSDSTSPIEVEEDPTPVTIYAHDWSITGAG